MYATLYFINDPKPKSGAEYGTFLPSISFILPIKFHSNFEKQWLNVSQK